MKRLVWFRIQGVILHLIIIFSCRSSSRDTKSISYNKSTAKYVAKRHLSSSSCCYGNWDSLPPTQPLRQECSVIRARYHSSWAIHSSQLSRERRLPREGVQFRTYFTAVPPPPLHHSSASFIIKWVIQTIQEMILHDPCVALGSGHRDTKSETTLRKTRKDNLLLHFLWHQMFNQRASTSQIDSRNELIWTCLPRRNKYSQSIFIFIFS